MSQTVEITEQKIWDYLKEVLDPEVPVLNVVELGIVREVELNGDSINVVVTPTYSGCPAMQVIEDDIAAKLKEKGFQNVKLSTVLSPAWTTDWLTDEAKKKLKDYGIAPPERATTDKDALFGKPKECPQCGSENTEMKSQFGSTACKALYVCQDCLEPFDYFKCH